MSGTLPSSLALTSIADGASIVAADHRNNYAAVQAAVNALIAAAGVTAKGDLLAASGANALANVAVGANGAVLVADSTQPQGVKWALPPGAKLAYAEQIANQTSIATTAATAASVVSAGPVTFDGTEVLIEFYTPGAQHSVNDSAAVFELYDSATDLGEIGQTFSPVANGADALTLRRYMTPSAGSHTYSIRMWSPTAGTTTALAGAGGAGVLLPLYIRILKA